MEKIYTALAAHSNWWSDNPLSVSRLDPKLRTLVCTKGSLTTALVSLSDGNFAVNLMRQRITLPYFHEQKKQVCSLSQAAMIREVELKIHGEAVVYARSIIPLSLVSKGRNGLANLGRTPLGHLLFSDGRIRVSKRDFMQDTFDQQLVTARRTPYDYQGSQILVSEFFLPALSKYLKDY